MVTRKPSVARLLFIVWTALGVGRLGVAQAPPPSWMNTPNGVLAIPAASGSVGRKDATALTELTAHLATVGSDPWLGMQAQGTIIFGASSGTSYAATFTTEALDRFRLDAQTKTGSLSVRIQGHSGKIKNDADAPAVIPPDTAALGLFPFALPRILTPAAMDGSLIDHGMVTVGSAKLHRIAYETAGAGHNPKSTSRIAMDLYFDPNSHLLVASAASGTLTESRGAQFLFVTKYSDYRRVGASMIPFELSETMNDVTYWILQLSDVQLNPALTSNYFVF